MSFAQVQQAFMAHIRNPELVARPKDVSERRIKIYNELFFNNIEGFVASAFPVLKSLYERKDWLALVRQFFTVHNCQSPYFLEISQEFLSFLQHSYELTPNDPVFMLELAHYEWVELDVSVCLSSDNYCAISDWQTQPLYLKDTARNLSYTFAVHQISEEFVPQQPSEQPHYFVVYRDADEEVAFISSNPMTALLLNVLEQNSGIVLPKLVEAVLTQVPQFTYEQLSVGAQQTLSAMADLGVVASKN
ncbi:HvfC family RiPP maturation protein [Pseudoalteromonas aurantia]|uniref:DUF2063 domain-containing protein n=1 Tax=Pseudoalteromonas aurantia 208 TaxID=1314867 RepID=A0ABR9ECK4_9GAMM|nr:putative DNA-binding domain-containing protein [Pseudoalteromonas aurantia]MBE0368712.1 hypothetical protein [Pseudoalteromonas aurantia 208]